MCVCFLPWYEFVAASRVQWVDVTARVVEYTIPEVFGELESHFLLGQCHFFTMPNIHLTAEVEHEHLQDVQHKNRDNSRDILECLSMVTNTKQRLYLFI